MTDTNTPDPAENKPSTPGSEADDRDVVSAVDPAHNMPSQAEGAPEEEEGVIPAMDPAHNKPSQAEG